MTATTGRRPLTAGEECLRLLQEAGFPGLARLYREQTRFALVAIDAEGNQIAPRPRPEPSGQSGRAARAQALSEALRWGEPCVTCDREDRTLWAVPVMRNQRLLGGLLVQGGELRRPLVAGRLDQRLGDACRRLLQLAVDHDLTNAALLAERRAAAHREREKAEALHAVKDRLLDNIRSIYLHEEPELLAAIRRGQKAEARKVINRVLTAIYMLGQKRTELLKSLCLELVVMMVRAAVQAGGDPEAILGLNYLSLTELAKVNDQEALAAWLCGMLEQLIDAIGANTRHPNSVQLIRALQYLEAHFGGAVSREEVARAAGLSPSHFSRLFKAGTGWSFTECLTRMRVEHACLALVGSQAGLAEIALTCGFGDQSYFSRVFRRQVGETPGDYRKRHLPGGAPASARKSQKEIQESKQRGGPAG